jgi:hypothetical protein
MKMAVQRPAPFSRRLFAILRERAICNGCNFGFLAAPVDTVYQGCAKEDCIGTVGVTVRHSLDVV